MPFDLTPLISTTINKYAEKKCLDNVSARVPLLGWFKEKGRIKNWDGGGIYIEEPVLGKIDTTKVQGLEEYQEIDIKPESGQVVVPFTPKRIVNSVAISHDELERNAGEEKMIDLLESKLEQADIEIAESFEEMLFSDGTLQDGKVILGLQAIIPTTPTAGTLCGYDRSSSANSWIRTQALSGAKTTDAYDNLKLRMETMYNNCTRGVIKPELAITTQTIFEAYKELYGDKFMFQDQKVADLGFDNVKFRNAAVVFADKLTEACMYFINSQALRLRARLKNGSPFQSTPMVDLAKSTAKMFANVSLILFRGALTANYFRTLGKIHSIT